METRGRADQPIDEAKMLIDERTRELLGGLHARMSEQDLAIAELERRVKALEEALRLFSGGGELR